MKKPTVEQVAWVFEKINENAGGSFRNLIYKHMEFTHDDYCDLYHAGGQNITNAMFYENKSLNHDPWKDLLPELDK